MRKAYDTILLSEVEAELAVKYGGNEPYRYECACCGEEVQICAADSIFKTAHFRHSVRGNNDIVCENYLHSHSTICIDALSRRSKREKVEFYYSNLTKTFSLGLKYSSNEIDACEQAKSNFEIRTDGTQSPFYSVPICRNNFAPNKTELITLTNFSWAYYISNTEIKYELFHRDAKNNIYPSFFKLQSEDDNFKARLVRGKTLYTNTRYILIFTHQYGTLSFHSGVEIHQRFIFETMNRGFCAFVISFINKTSQLENQLASWGYSLEAAETLTLLWPPAPIFDDTYLLSNGSAYLYSSFELQAHGNINVHPADISKDSNGVSHVSINQTTKILQKNMEISINKTDAIEEVLEPLIIEECTNNKITVSENETFFLFGDSGTAHLSEGQTVLLTPNVEINKYVANYVVKRISYCQKETPTSETVLKDILLHYKRVESFESAQFTDVNPSTVASEYINKCKVNGTINSVVKDYILEGLL